MEDDIVSRLTSHRVPAIVPVQDILEDASAGLIETTRSMSPKYFYDERGPKLFDAIYWPFDVYEEMLPDSGEQLVQEYDWLRVNTLVGDYHGGLAVQQHFEPDNGWFSLVLASQANTPVISS